MPIINCPDCTKEMSDAAPSCPNCGRPNLPMISAPTERRVSILLGVGIFLMPLIFAWFTLRKGYSTKAKLISFAWLIFTLAIFVAKDDGKNSLSSNSTTHTAVDNAPAQTAPEPAPAETAMQLDISRLLGDYEGNEVAADNKYKGNTVQVTGKVGDIKKDIMDNLYVTLGTGKEFEIPQVQAFFDDSMNGQLGNLRKGQELTVVCKIKGLMMNVLAEDCFIK